MPKTNQAFSWLTTVLGSFPKYLFAFTVQLWPLKLKLEVGMLTPNLIGWKEITRYNHASRFMLKLFNLKHLICSLKNACDKSPCKNGGTSQSGSTGQQYKCLCPLGFAGEHCEHPGRKNSNNLTIDAADKVRYLKARGNCKLFRDYSEPWLLSELMLTGVLNIKLPYGITSLNSSCSISLCFILSYRSQLPRHKNKRSVLGRWYVLVRTGWRKPFKHVPGLLWHDVIQWRMDHVLHNWWIR